MPGMYLGPERRRGFHLDIDSVEEFIAFCAFIRGETLQDDKLKELAKKLGGATKELLAAEKADKQT